MDDRVGKATWFDLMAADAVDAMAFYEGLFGWKFLRMKEPALRDYWVIQAGGELIGGLRQSSYASQTTRASEDKGLPSEALRRESAQEGPVIYFTVKELMPAVARARELGASLVGDRMDLGEDRGSYQWIKDRQKNVIALWGPK
jgi:predicted enzyme related to lactoylglutathione lyase